MKNATVYGESARGILAAMSKSDRSVGDDGMHRFDLPMTADEATPVVRALMRAEAELLAADADAFDPQAEIRTAEQRRADAMVAVVTSAAEALALRQQSNAQTVRATRCACRRWPG